MVRLFTHMWLLSAAGLAASAWYFAHYLGSLERPDSLYGTWPGLLLLVTIAATVIGLMIANIGGNKALDKQRAIGGWLWAAWAPLYLVMLITHLITLL